MKLIKDIGIEKKVSNKGTSYIFMTSLFECPICKKLVVRRKTNGLRDKSCGCANISIINKDKYNNKQVYRLYDNIKTRCYNIKCGHYKSYGARGIKLCEDWLNSRFKFYNWAINNGWKKGLQIDRIDVNGNYEPSNCRFVTNITNSRNKQNTVLSLEKIPLINMLLKCSISNKEIGKVVNVSQRTISHIKNKTQWC